MLLHLNWIFFFFANLVQSFKHGMYEIDVKNKAATLYDDSAKFETTTLPTIALAISRILRLPEIILEKYANRNFYVSLGFVSQPEIFELVKKVTGTSDGDWKITHSNYEARLQRGADELARGNFMGMADIVYGIGMKPGMGRNYSETKGLGNDVLGLPETEDLLASLKTIV